jgi:hypothetical protein
MALCSVAVHKSIDGHTGSLELCPQYCLSVCCISPFHLLRLESFEDTKSGSASVLLYLTESLNTVQKVGHLE